MVVRVLSSVAAFLILGSLIYIYMAGVGFMSGSLFVGAVSGLGVLGVIEGDGVLDMMACFFESFFDGLMEVIGGIFDIISSVFG